MLSIFAATYNTVTEKEIWYDRIDFDWLILEENLKTLACAYNPLIRLLTWGGNIKKELYMEKGKALSILYNYENKEKL